MAGRILLVEDDPTIGEILTSSLRSHAYEVSWERTGAGGLARAGIGPLDLVLLDLGLPDLDGVEVCRQLRRIQPECVLVMLTARSAEMDVVVGLEAGADDYLVKPVRLAEFHARIRAHLRRNGAGTTDTAVRAVVRPRSPDGSSPCDRRSSTCSPA
jgi:DNA-binding response OmpR family regulator